MRDKGNLDPKMRQHIAGMALEELVVGEDRAMLRSLFALLQRRKVKVFVGAGVTRAYGYPDWRKLLFELAQSKGEGTVPRAVLEELRRITESANPATAGNFEQIAEKIHHALAGDFLHLAVDETFKRKDLDGLTGTALEALARFDCGPFFTTNFDPMLEVLIAKQHGVPLEQVALIGRYNQVIEALQRDDSRKVVKLHGTYNDRNDRVLTKSEYDEAYTSVTRPVAWVLRHLFCSQSVLFVGCSLDQDRTLTVLEEARKFDPARWHYALVGEDVHKNTLQRWRKLHINAIRFRRAPEPDPFANLPVLLKGLADHGHPIEIGTEPRLLAVIKTPPIGSKDRLEPKGLIDAIRSNQDRPDGEVWAPLSSGDLLNIGPADANDSTTTISAQWRGKVPAPLPAVVAAAGCLLRHIRNAVDRQSASELKVTFGFGNPLRLQGDRYLGTLVTSALHLLNRTRPLNTDAGSPTPLVFETSCVDSTATVEQTQFPGLTVLDPMEGVFRTLDLSWTPGDSQNSQPPSPMRLTVVCPQFQPRPSLLSLKHCFNSLSNPTLVLDLLEPLRKARRPAFELARFEKLFGLLGDSIQVADLQLALEENGKISLHSKEGFMFKSGRTKRMPTVELIDKRKVHLFFDADKWEITTECSQAGTTLIRIISARPSLPNLLQEWGIDPAEGEHNQILFQLPPTLQTAAIGDHQI